MNGKDFYDEQQFRDFYTWFQQDKASTVLKADPELYTLDPQTVVSINKAAALLNFSGPAVIRKYLQANPGYFPTSVGPVEGPTGRSIPGFRVGDLQDFDTRRTGDKLGKAGRRPGPQPQAPVGRPSALEEALAAELGACAGGEPLTATQLAEQFAAEAIERDGYRPGLAAELSVQHGGAAAVLGVRRTQRPQAPPRSRTGPHRSRPAGGPRPHRPARTRRHPRTGRLPRPRARRQPRRLVPRSQRRPPTHRPHHLNPPTSPRTTPS